MKAAFLDDGSAAIATANAAPPPTPPKDQSRSNNAATTTTTNNHYHQTNKQPPPPPQTTQQHHQQQPSSSSSSNREQSGSAPTLKSIGNYVLQQSLGKGSMGKVKLGVHNVTGEKVAVKIVPRANFQLSVQRIHANSNKTPRQIAKEQAREHNREMRTIREAHIMMLLRHPHIVGLKDMVISGPYFYISMEYVNGGQLLHYIIKRQRLSERRARHFSRQITSALDYMHRNSIAHRDLKIENILIDKAGRNVKLIDFGLSNLFAPEKLLTTYCGSLYFAAPELLRANPYKGPEIDVWSLGVVIYVMVTGAVPFDDKSMPGLHEKIKRGHVTYPQHMSDECRHLLTQIFATDPAKRIILQNVIRHPWLNPDSNTPLIKNFVPPRKPLELPLNQVVLEQMTHGFELGTADEIREKLEVIIQSPVYQEAACHVAQQQAVKPPSPPPMSSEERWTVPYDDPQSVPDAYHPLISLYYLTKERMMEKQQDSPTSAAATTGVHHSHSLSRKASVESTLSMNGGTQSARSSQGSLHEPEQQQQQQQHQSSPLGPRRTTTTTNVPQGDPPVLPSSLPNRPDYQLLADASVPGFSSQPSAAVGSGDYLSRIQRWLRSSTSQHHLDVEENSNNNHTKPPPSSSPLQQQAEPATDYAVPANAAAAAAAATTGTHHHLHHPDQGLPTPPDSAIDEQTAQSMVDPPHIKRSLFRKLSHALLRKPPAPAPPLTESDVSHAAQAARDRPLPPLPPNATTATQPTTSAAGGQQLPPPQPQDIAMPTPALKSSVNKYNKHQAAVETSYRRGHQRSASSASAQQAATRSLSMKINAWLNRSSSAHKATSKSRHF